MRSISLLPAVERLKPTIEAVMHKVAASKKSEREEREADQVAGEMTCWIEGDPRRVLGTLARKAPAAGVGDLVN